jgi:predicted porin
MKKSLLALAALTAFAGAASAQSSVTLFGVVDLSARYTEYDDKGQTNWPPTAMPAAAWDSAALKIWAAA